MAGDHQAGRLGVHRLQQHGGRGHAEGPALRQGRAHDEGAPRAEAGRAHADSGGEDGGRTEHDRRVPVAEDDGPDDGDLPQRGLRMVRRCVLQRGLGGRAAHDVAASRGSGLSKRRKWLAAVHSCLLFCHHHGNNRGLRRHPPPEQPGAGNHHLCPCTVRGLHRAVLGARLSDRLLVEVHRDADDAGEAGRAALHEEEVRAEGAPVPGPALHRARLRDRRHHLAGHQDHGDALGLAAEPAGVGSHRQRAEAVPPL
mmetsp:Transcript_82169/g.255148  ORF Transcript_82169/g.255148 Transcript_82169/m.255148 type:complete len:255 (+) Transcript_82169:1151-1915(+)